jgi:hypothetical protein
MYVCNVFILINNVLRNSNCEFMKAGKFHFDEGKPNVALRVKIKEQFVKIYTGSYLFSAKHIKTKT